MGAVEVYRDAVPTRPATAGRLTCRKSSLPGSLVRVRESAPKRDGIRRQRGGMSDRVRGVGSDRIRRSAGP